MTETLHSPAALLTPGLPDDARAPGQADHALTLVTGIVKPLDISVITNGTRVICFNRDFTSLGFSLI